MAVTVVLDDIVTVQVTVVAVVQPLHELNLLPLEAEAGAVSVTLVPEL